MKISCISDVHIKSNNCGGMKTITTFLSNETVQSSDKVMLLGDIFDHLAGSFEEYFEVYSNYFDALAEILKKGVEVHYVEGNHDVHLCELYTAFIKRYELADTKFSHTSKNVKIKDNNKNLYFSHGDEHDLNNMAYHRWKSILMSSPVKFLVTNIVSFKKLDQFARWASSDSKRRNLGRDIEQQIREKFRIGAMKQFKNGQSIVIGGHSHVKDHFVHKLEDSTYEYANNGFPQDTKHFVYVNDGVVEFKEF
jgi:UDP-2,3-diacylglucosamine hydrolase